MFILTEHVHKNSSYETTFITDHFKTDQFITDHIHNRPRSQQITFTTDHQRCAWTGSWIFWTRTPAASGRIRVQVFL